MSTSYQVSPAIAWRGQTPQCTECTTDIQIGAPAVVGGKGLVQYHAECFKRRLAELAEDGQAAVGGGHQAVAVGLAPPTAAVAAHIGGDIGDAVADELDRLLGRAPKQTRLEPTAPPSLGQYLAECESLGPRNPMTGLRPTQDLGDAIAERMAEERKGYR